MKSDWTATILYYNKHAGKKLTLTDLRCDLNFMNEKMMLRYRAMLTSAGYIEILKEGLYKVIKKIPINLTCGGKIKGEKQ